MEVVKAQYWQLIDSGITQQENSVALYLLHSVDIALNDFNNQLFDWEIVEHEVAASSLYRRCLQGMLDCTQRLESLASFYRRVLEIENRRHEEYCIMLCLVFYHAHETARNKLRYYLADELHGENNSALGGETELSQHYLTALEAVEDESLHQVEITDVLTI